MDLSVGKHYYYFKCYDKAGNYTSTYTATIGSGGAGNNIVHTDSGFWGLESYWNYKTLGLGRAGTAQVNLNNGGLILSATDFSLPGRGIPLTMTRYYNSLSDYDGMLGKGWRTSFESYLTLDGQNVKVNDPDGSSHTFTYVNDTNFTPPAGEYRKIILSNNLYTVIEKNGTQYHYGTPVDNMAKLQSIEDRFGNILTLTYSNGLLVSVQEASGRAANFEYIRIGDKSYLYTVTFTPLEGTNASRYIQYDYLGTELAQVSYPGQDPSDMIKVRYGYDPYLGLLNLAKVDYQDVTKNKTQFVYKSCSNSIDTVSSQFNTYGDNFAGAPGVPSRAVSVNYLFDYETNVTTLTDPNGGQYVYTHDDNGQCVSLNNPCDNAINYTYDSNYNMLTQTQAKKVYDPATGTETLRNVITGYQYDGNGNLTSITRDQGFQNLVTVIQYESYAHRYVVTDITGITDPRGNTTAYTNTFDADEKLTTLTIASPDDYKIVHTFDPYGQRITKDVKLKDGDTSKSHYEYGYTGGLLTNLTNAYGTTTYDYTVYGERKTMLDANGVQTSYGIDPRTGNLTSVAAPVDTSGRLDAYNAISGSRFVYIYDANNNKITETDAKNHTKINKYDELNHLYWVVTPYIDAITRYNAFYRYDANSNLIQQRDLNGAITSFAYDALNRKITTTDANLKVQEAVTYDEAGRIKTKLDGKGNKTEYLYDSVDNILCTNYYEGSSTLKFTSTFTYDANGNLLTETVPISSYDQTGTIVTSYQYDTVNRPISVVTTCADNSKFNQTIGYTYEAGQLTTMAVTTGSGTVTYTYNYDNAQRLDNVVNSSGQKIKFDYYAGGQRSKKSIYKQSGDTDAFMSIDYKYDSAYRLKQLNYGWGSYHYDLGYTYNEIDKITDNSVDYNVNAPDVAEYLTRRAGLKFDYDYKDSFTNSYSYDELGRLTYSRINGINPLVNVQYTTDPWTGLQMARVFLYPNVQKTTYSQLDANGNPGYKEIKSTEPIGNGEDWLTATESSSYDYLNRLQSKHVSPPSDDSYTMTASYDANGNDIRERFTDDRPDTSMEYGLDNQLYYLSSKTKIADNPTLYKEILTKYSYELEGFLRRELSGIKNISSASGLVDVNYTNYFYYGHDGVVAELHDDVGKTKNFTRLGRELLVCNESNGNTYYYIQTNRGDVVMLVGANGNVNSIRDYDASGQIMLKAPDIDKDRDPFGFIGGLNSGNGLWKLGARFYDSGKNSFIQQDRYMGDVNDPLSLNRYVYCGMDPVNNVDPSGLWQWVFKGEGELKWVQEIHVGVLHYRLVGLSFIMALL